MEKKLLSAKYAYLLSTCNIFSNKAFIKLFNYFEKDKILASKYYYELWFTLDINKNLSTLKDSEDSYFYNKSVFNKFLGNLPNKELNYIILEHLNTIAWQDKYIINNNYLNLVGKSEKYYPQFENHCKKHLYTLINLINIYRQNNYKFLFLSLILDYSQDIGLVHQCGLIIDLINGEFIFYEPYGTYIKYDHDYSRPIGEFLQIYYEILPANFKTESGKIKYYTFHEKFGLKDGIQNIILISNNNNSDKFDKIYNETIEKIKGDIPVLYERINNIKKSNPVYQTDKTMVTLEILSIFNKIEVLIEDEKKNNFIKYWETMLELYHDYNSKTCVSITLVELYHFFSSTKMIDNYIKHNNLNKESKENNTFNKNSKRDILKSKVTEFTQKYRNANRPNLVLLESLYDFINKHLISEISYNDSNNMINKLNTEEICNIIKNKNM